MQYTPKLPCQNSFLGCMFKNKKKLFKRADIAFLKGDVNTVFIYNFQIYLTM